LLRVDPDDPTGTKIVGDLAESWASARNGRAWTFNLRRAVKFHDDSELTARDVKASYVVVDAVDAPDAKISMFKEIVGVQGVGTPFATPPAELETLAGYGRDVGAARTEARRLLKEAGVPEGFSFTFRNRAIRDPYESLGVWLVDQWRQIGLNVEVETLELATLYNEIRGGNFDVAADFHCSSCIVEPDLALFKFQSADVSHVNDSRSTDRTLDELYRRQSRATDREERRRSIREFEKRLLDDEVHDIVTFQWHRIVPHNARLRGWTITPSHFLDNQLDTVWLAPE